MKETESDAATASGSDEARVVVPEPVTAKEMAWAAVKVVSSAGEKAAFAVAEKAVSAVAESPASAVAQPL